MWSPMYGDLFYFICVNERKIDTENNDISYDAVNRCVARATTTINSIAQEIRTKLQTVRGECFTDRDAGVDWYGSVLGENILSVDAVKADVSDVIKSVNGVRMVTEVKVTIDGRNTKYDYKVELNDGSVLEDSV